MKVRVNYTALLSVIAKKRFDEFELAESQTVIDFVELLSAKYGYSFAETVFDRATGKLRFPVFVNGEPQSPEYVLQDNDTVSFIIAMSGG